MILFAILFSTSVYFGLSIFQIFMVRKLQKRVRENEMRLELLAHVIFTHVRGGKVEIEFDLGNKIAH